MFMELAEPFSMLRVSATKELTKTSESTNSMSETMRELMVMELAEPLRMLRLSATKELTKTSESTNRISETMRELMVMELAEPFSVAKNDAVKLSTAMAGTLRVLTVRVLMEPTSAEMELTSIELR
jgi:hypothetical protein